MDDFQQTKQGFWYPTVIHNTMPSAPVVNPQQEQPAIEQWKTTIRYHFDFTADLPDSLFTIEVARAAQ